MSQLLEIPKSAFASDAAADELAESGLATDSRFAALCNASHGVVVQIGDELPRCFGVTGGELTEFASVPLSLVLKESTTAEQIATTLASGLLLSGRTDPNSEVPLNIWSFDRNPADPDFDIWTDELRPILSLASSGGQLLWLVQGQEEVSAQPISLEEAEGLIAISIQALCLPSTQPTAPLSAPTDQTGPNESVSTVFLDRYQLAQMVIDQEQGDGSPLGGTLFSPAVVAKVSVTSDQQSETTYFSIDGSSLAVWTPRQDGVSLEYMSASESKSKVDEALERCLGVAMEISAIEPGEFEFDLELEDPTSSTNAPKMIQAVDSRDQLRFSIEAVRMDADMMIRGVAFEGFASPEIGLWELEQKPAESGSGTTGCARQLADSDLKRSIDSVLSADS